MKQKDSMISSMASEQPPREKGAMPSVSNMPGKMKGDKMPHEVMNDKMAKGLNC